MKGNFQEVDKIVKPRNPAKPRHWPLIAVHLDARSVLVERTGETLSIDDAAALVRLEPPSLWICPNASWLVYDLDKALGDDECWQFRASPVKRTIVNKNNLAQGRQTRMRETMVQYFGYRSAVPKKAGHWHHPIDPICFMSQTLGDLLVPDPLIGLLKWGQDIRAWCAANGLTPSPTAGGLAAQLLRDPRFYPVARRKVPAKTNARARLALPGNHYDVRVDSARTYTGLSLDMKSAHHNVAASLTFPHADGLIARGHYRAAVHTDTTVPDTPAWRASNARSFPQALTGHGLFQLRLTVPRLNADAFPPPYASRPGQRLAWVFSNELPMLHELGVIVDGIEAAWTSYRIDNGMNHYAQWALTEIATMTPERRVWAKPVLLATYGMLAARPRTAEWGYRQAAHGTPRAYPTGHGILRVIAHVADTERETPTVNVIQRGMIEAETRLQVLSLARTLTSKGVEVLCIYADGIIVKSGSQLPLLPHPWVVKGELTNLQFVNVNAYRADQESKLPGLAHGSRARKLVDLRRIR